ncbi:MAG: acyl-CoA desaturase [Alphaproteobacteria bacterium]|nr:acyl-CoA desaturase [Alphaproteobacteria bacterium]MCB9697198.1 acyl-CoA desaturase [Alphaproteobacteria bacterium]
MSRPETLFLRPDRLREQRVAFLLATALPAIGALAAPVATAAAGHLGWPEATFLPMLVVSGVGVELGYHRLLAHRAFETVPAVRLLFAAAGATAVQGPPLYWVANHRLHHAHSDGPGDPHTPHGHPRGRWAGLWHAHLGWIFDASRPNPGHWARDLLADRALMRVNRLHLLWAALSVVLPALLGAATEGASGALRGALWGGLLRIFVAQQGTYAINSLCHVIGTRPYRSNDLSTNVGWLALPSFGGSLHNNHHAFPSTATNDLDPGQLDPSGWVVRGLAAVGLAWDLRRPSEEQRRRRLRVPGGGGDDDT